jgi:hypothetical protein
MSTFAERMIGAAKLDVSIYEEVEADRTATGQAMAVVILTSVAAGIGGLRLGLGGLVGAVIAALIAWFLWAFLAFLIGTADKVGCGRIAAHHGIFNCTRYAANSEHGSFFGRNHQFRHLGLAAHNNGYCGPASSGLQEYRACDHRMPDWLVFVSYHFWGIEPDAGWYGGLMESGTVKLMETLTVPWAAAPLPRISLF